MGVGLLAALLHKPSLLGLQLVLELLAAAKIADLIPLLWDQCGSRVQIPEPQPFINGPSTSDRCYVWICGHQKISRLSQSNNEWHHLYFCCFFSSALVGSEIAMTARGS